MDDIPYESIVEESNDGILVAQHGEIVYANERLQELTGYAEATLVGAPKTMPITDDDAALVEQYHSARTGGDDAPDQYEVTLETKSGDRIPIEFSVHQISYDGEPAVVAFCRDTTEQKGREATLEDLKREYESVFDHVQDALFLLDVDDHGTIRFKRFNEREEAFTGKSTEEIRGKTPAEVFGDELGSELLANYKECLERRETVIYEEELDLSDETTIWQTKLTPIIVDGTVERIVGSGREITELRNREQELEQAKTRLRALFDKAPDAIAIHDADGDILDVNEQNIENLGYTHDELLEMNVTEFEVGLDPETAQDMWTEMDIGETAKVEGKHQRKDGSTFPAEVWVSKIEVLDEPQYLALGRDITARKERERALSRFRAFVENTSDVITTINSDGTVEYVSPASSHVSGHEPEELVGTEAIEHVHPADREAVSEQLAELIATPGSRATAEYRFQHDDGSWIWVESTGINRLDDPKIEGIVLVSRDITERKQYEGRLDRLHDATRALVQADTHESIAEIAVETACDTLDLPITGLWLHDETENVLRPTAVTDAGRDLLGEPPVFDPGTNLSWEAFQAQAVKMFDDVASQPARYNPETPLRSEIILPLGDHGVMNIGATERATFDETDRSLAHILAANVESALTRADQQQELSRQTERLDLALEGGQMGVWDWTVQTDEVRFDERWAEMLGHSLDEIEPHLSAWKKRTHPEDLPDAEAALEAHFAGKTEYYKCDHRMQTKSGDWIWVRDTGKVVERDDDGDPVRAVGTHLDITERKRREQELKESKERIAEQNNALESFTDIVTAAERTVDQQITDLLDLGASYLDLDIGILSEIDGSEYTVRNVVAPGDTIEPGDTFNLTDTYCSLVYDADGPVVFHSADTGSVKDHPAYQKQGMEAYVGVPVFVDDQRYGTLNFSRPESRESPITEAEESFVRIIAEWIGTELTRQQRKQELKRTSQFLQDSQDVANIGGWEVALQSETLRWSEQVYHIHGLPLDANPTPEDGIEFYHPEDRDTIRDAFNRLTTEGDPYDLDLRIIRADNDEVRWVRTLGEPRYEDDEIVAVHGTFQDITERKRREQKLRQFREAVEQTAHAVYITDTDGTIEYVNPAFEDITGYSESEAVGQTPQLLSADEHEDAFYEDLWETVRDGERWESEMIDKRADGEEVIIYQTISTITDSDSEPQKFVAVARDITERKEYEEALEAAHENLRQIIDLVPDLIFVKNREGKYLLANETTAELYGTSPEGVEGRHESEVIPSINDSEQFRQDDVEVIESGEPKFIPEEELTSADGETRILQTTKIPYQVPESGEEAVLGYARDVTELTEYQRKLESQRDNLEILNQVVRHDIRNDLQLVLAYAETLASYVDAESNEYIEQVLNATRDAIDITTTARDVTRVMLQSDVELKPVRLRPALESEVDNVRSNYDAALVRIDGTIPDIEVLGDGMLESVLRNLLKNAIQHNDKEVPEVSVSATQEDDIVVLRITDNGPGISDERKEEIFQQGEMGLDSEGTGLGLYLVETLVDRYGGSVYVEDNDPMGAVFVVEIPLAA